MTRGFGWKKRADGGRRGFVSLAGLVRSYHTAPHRLEPALERVATVTDSANDEVEAATAARISAELAKAASQTPSERAEVGRLRQRLAELLTTHVHDWVVFQDGQVVCVKSSPDAALAHARRVMSRGFLIVCVELVEAQEGTSWTSASPVHVLDLGDGQRVPGRWFEVVA